MKKKIQAKESEPSLKTINEKIMLLEGKFESQPKHIIISSFLYVFLFTTLFGMTLGLLVNAENIKEITTNQVATALAEQKSLGDIIQKLESPGKTPALTNTPNNLQEDKKN